MSISSLVSFSRLPIRETVPGMEIASYNLEATDGVTPFILHVRDTYYYKPNLLDQMDHITVTSEKLVVSIVHDYISAQIIRDINAYPALFAVPNVEVKIEHFSNDRNDELSSLIKMEALKAKNAQRNWFIRLVELADNDYEQYKRPAVVSHIQRVAARELNLKRPWIELIEDESVKPSCPFCANNLLNASAPVCPNCKNIINQAAFSELEARIQSQFGEKKNPFVKA